MEAGIIQGLKGVKEINLGMAAWQMHVTQEVRATFAVECWEFLAVLPCSSEDGWEDKKE